MLSNGQGQARAKYYDFLHKWAFSHVWDHSLQSWYRENRLANPETKNLVTAHLHCYLLKENIFLMEFREQHKSLIKTQLRNNMCDCFVIYYYNNFPITIVSLFWAKLYLHCEGSWSGPSGSWLGREPCVPKCTSERQYTGCIIGLKLEMSKHFAYLHISDINCEKNQELSQS